MIYFVSSGSSATGGPTLMHQGCYEVQSAGLSASMLYVDVSSKEGIHAKHLAYNLNFTFGFEIISDEDVVIVPEQFGLIRDVLKLECRKVIWWLSVDNFIVSYNFFGLGGKLKKIGAMIRARRTSDIDYILYSSWDVEKIMTTLAKNGIYHWVQSEYANQFLCDYGIDSVYVGDYLTEEFFRDTPRKDKKKSIVAYNPRKGAVYIEELIRKTPDLKFIPIQNLTPQGVKDLLARAKVYIDLGNHPGQDRIPREAAMSGCLIVTSNRGSAANIKDVPIPANFKVEVNPFDALETGDLLRKMVNNYEKYISAFSNYTEYIEGQRENFQRDINKAVARL
jgi:hypothetical protein